MDTLACTDRDGLHGAVRFAKACHRKAGIAPVVGVDLAFEGEGGPWCWPSPGRGGPRCAASSAPHSSTTRGALRSPPARPPGRHRDDLVVVLGHDSALGAALAAHDASAAERVLRGWRDVLDPGQLVVVVTHHRVAGAGPGSAGLAGRMLAFADSHGLVGVLTNAVRMAHKTDAPVADVLDAARRLVPLDIRNVDRRNAEGYLPK